MYTCYKQTKILPII